MMQRKEMAPKHSYGVVHTATQVEQTFDKGFAGTGKIQESIKKEMTIQQSIARPLLVEPPRTNRTIVPET